MLKNKRLKQTLKDRRRINYYQPKSNLSEEVLDWNKAIEVPK